MSFFVGKRPSNGKPLLHINSVTPANGSIQEAPDTNTIFHSDLPYIFVKEYVAASGGSQEGIGGVGGNVYTIPTVVQNAMLAGSVVLIVGDTSSGAVVGYPQVSKTSVRGDRSVVTYKTQNPPFLAYRTVNNTAISRVFSVGLDYTLVNKRSQDSVSYCQSAVFYGYYVDRSYNFAYKVGYVDKYTPRTPYGTGEASSSGNLPPSAAGYMTPLNTNQLWAPRNGSYEFYPGYSDSIKKEAGGIGALSVPVRTLTQPIAVGGSSDNLYRQAGTSVKGGVANNPTTTLRFLVLNVKNTPTGYQYNNIVQSGSEVYVDRNTFKVGSVSLATETIISEVARVPQGVAVAANTLGDYKAPTGYGFSGAPSLSARGGGCPIVKGGQAITYSSGTTRAVTSVVNLKRNQILGPGWEIASNNLSIKKGGSPIFSTTSRVPTFLGGTYSFTIAQATRSSNATYATWNLGLLGATTTLLVTLSPTNTLAIPNNTYLLFSSFVSNGSYESIAAATNVNMHLYTLHQVASLASGDTLLLSKIETTSMNQESAHFSRPGDERWAPVVSYTGCLYLERSGSNISLKGLNFSGVAGIRVNFMRLT